MSEDLIKAIQDLINSGKGDTIRLHSILHAIQKGKTLYNSDKKYLSHLIPQPILEKESISAAKIILSPKGKKQKKLAKLSVAVFVGLCILVGLGYFFGPAVIQETIDAQLDGFYAQIPSMTNSLSEISVDGFFLWLGSLSFWDLLVLFLVPAIVDYSRSFGKSTFLLLHSIKERKKRKLRKDLKPNFKISLLIPAHNEEAGIKHALEAAIDCTYQNKEIIVIDDGSTDNTYRIAQEFAQKGLIKLVRREQSSGSKAAALNYGAAYSTGDIMMCIDADTLIERKSIEEIAKYFEDKKVAAVSGNVRILSGDRGVKNLVTRLQAYEYVVSMEMGRRYNAILNSLLIISGAFGAFRKEVFGDIGMYDKDTITEDFDLTVKVRKTGGRLEFATEGISWTFCPNNWKSWWRQRVRWSHGQMATLVKHKDILKTSNYRSALIMSIYDMWIMDIVFLILRFIWFPFLIFQFAEVFVYLMTLFFIVYIISETFVLAIAVILSPRKSDLRLAYLAPVMVFFYRPLYSLLRFIAFITWFFGKNVKW